MTEEVTHAQIVERIESVQAELKEFKDDSKEHRKGTLERLGSIEKTLAGLKGGWKVLALVGAILAGTLAAIASVVAITKGLK